MEWAGAAVVVAVVCALATKGIFFVKPSRSVCRAWAAHTTAAARTAAVTLSVLSASCTRAHSSDVTDIAPARHRLPPGSPQRFRSGAPLGAHLQHALARQPQLPSRRLS
ncbi:hypothetical protein AcV5_008066 [Taiwanofungus camphoratus]|nr:hypothetical protein AcV5_008066 [Antrodia cinnamomea]